MKGEQVSCALCCLPVLLLQGAAAGQLGGAEGSLDSCQEPWILLVGPGPHTPLGDFTLRNSYDVSDLQFLLESRGKVTATLLLLRLTGGIFRVTLL